MDKSPEAFRTISEVADWLGVPTHVLRFWESRFSQVKPVKRAGGRRYYRPADMALLGGIKKLLHEDGLTIRGVQKVLREQGVKHVAALAPSPDVAAGAGMLVEDASRVETAESSAGEMAGADGISEVEAVEGAAVASAESADGGDPDESLMRFPFADEPEVEPGPEPEPVAESEPESPGVEPLEEAVAEPEMAVATPFVADVPGSDPDDDAPEFRTALALPSFVPAEVAFALKGKEEQLAAIQVRAIALRNRMRDDALSRVDH